MEKRKYRIIFIDEPLIVTVSEEGEDGLLLTMDGGESYPFTPMEIQEASIRATGRGQTSSALAIRMIRRGSKI